MSNPDVRSVVADLVVDETAGFRASYIASLTDTDVKAVQMALIAMVDDGDLELQYQLLCPDDGNVMARFTAEEALPLGEEVDREDCTPFVVEKRHIWVAYVPTKKLTASLLREARAGKVPARRRGVRHRALEALGIDSTKPQGSGRRPTSTST